MDPIVPPTNPERRPRPAVPPYAATASSRGSRLRSILGQRIAIRPARPGDPPAAAAAF